jgi:tetratricopeptide (TPR) repeat protein
MIPSRWAWIAIALAAVMIGQAEASPAATVLARRLMDKGVAHIGVGANGDAVAELTQALATKALTRTDVIRATYDRGVALDAMGKMQAAIADYSAAIGLDPTFAPALNNRANAYRRMGRIAAAKRDYLAALNCRGALREYPYFGLGQIAEKQGDAAAARDYYLKALAANPSFAVAAQGIVALDHQKQASLQRQALLQPVSTRAPSRVPRQPLVEVPVQRPAPLLRQAIVDTTHYVDAKPRGGTAQIQLGAFRDQASAVAGWDAIAGHSAGALGGHSPRIVTVDLPGRGRFWRLRTTVTDPQEARRLCAALNQQGHACIVPRD